MTFKQKTKLLIQKINEIPKDKICGGHMEKLRLLETITKAKTPKSKAEKMFFNLFVEPNIILEDVDTIRSNFYHHSELGRTKASRIVGIFGTKSQEAKLRKIYKYIYKDMDRYLFRFEYDAKEVTNVLDALDKEYKKYEDK